MVSLQMACDREHEGQNNQACVAQPIDRLQLSRERRSPEQCDEESE
jgi:hypothetical protein